MKSNLSNFFDKNLFSLNNKEDELINKSKEECSNYCIENNYEGFKYKGDYNKCYMFNSLDFDNNISNNFNNYNIKTYLKTKSTIDIKNIEDQHNEYKYFNKINNDKFMMKNNINKIDNISEKDCLNNCIKNNCKSVIFFEQPKKCDFYRNKDMIKNNKSDYELLNNSNKTDTYTIKKKILLKNKDKLNNLINYDVNPNSNINITKIKDVPFLYKCNGYESLNPFCTEKYNPNNIENNELLMYTDCLTNNNFNNNTDREKYYNKECKQKFGNEYVFDNNYLNIDSIIKCDNGNKKIKCKIDMNNNFILENFENYNILSETIYNKYIYIIIILIIFILFFIYFIFLSNKKVK
jgi:hypothetical protein